MDDGSAVRRDFDAIARALAAAEADTLQPSERALLGHLPPDCGRVLEIGCGHGVLTGHVAQRARTVLALDLSPEMIRLARSRTGGRSNVEYRVADVATPPLPPAAFDVVLSVATLHHLPLAPTVERLAAAVAPGGTLLRDERYLSPGEAVRTYAALLPGADVRRELEWRYTVVWRR